MKYIDAEKLIAEIERRIEEYNIQSLRGAELSDLLSFITSLQQEQPMPDSTKLIELWHEDKEMLKEKDFRDDPWRLAYNAFMCGFGRGIAVKKQEQLGVEFEDVEYLLDKVKYMSGYWIETNPDCAKIIRDFNNRLNARKEE